MRCFILLLLLILTGIQTARALPAQIAENEKTEVLPLEKVIAMTLSNNLDVRWNRADLAISGEQVRYAWGDFDPILGATATRESNRLTQTSQITVLTKQEVAGLFSGTSAASQIIGLGVSGVPQIYMQDNDKYQASLDGKTPLGTHYTLGLRANQLGNNLNDVLNGSMQSGAFSPEYDTFVGVTLTQPLLRDFGPSANLAAVRIARKNKEITRLTWEGKIITAIQTVLTTYYEMQYGVAVIEVREQAIEADKRFVSENQRRVDVGMMSPIDVQQAEVALSTDQESLLEAQNYFMERQYLLKRQILSSANMDDDGVFLPAGTLKYDPVHLDRNALMRDAMKFRLDYQQALKEAEIQNIKLRYGRNQLWPRLDVIGTYGYNGFGINSSFGSAFGNGFVTTTPSWSVGLQASIPIGNVQARSQLAQFKSAKEQAILKIKQVELTANLDVDTMLSRIQTNLQSLETSRQTRRLAEEAVKIAERQIEQGLISVFDALETKKKLYDARVREVSALAELNKSYVLLDVATGTLLQKHSIQVVE